MVTDDGEAPQVALPRLRQLLGEIPNLTEFARAAGLNRRMLDRYRNGMEPSLSAATKIARALNVPLDALVHDIRVSKPDTDDDLIRVPFLNLSASAGPGAHVDEIEVLGSIPYSRRLLRRYGVNPDNAHALTNRGDSMAPTIEDGQVILIDRSVRQIREDAIYVVSLDDDLRVKRVQKGIDGSVTLKSDNPAYAPERLAAPIAARLQVEGRVFLGERLL